VNPAVAPPPPAAAGPGQVVPGEVVPAVDVRLVPPALAAWAAVFWAVGAPPGHVEVAAVAAAGMAVGAGMLCRWRRVAALVLVLVAVTAVLGVVVVQRDRAQVGGLAALAAGRASVQLVADVRSDPRVLPAVRDGGRPRVVVDVRVRELRARGASAEVTAPVTVFADEDRWAGVLGDRVRLTGRLAPADPGERSVAVLTVGGSVAVVRPAGRVFDVADGLRAGLRAACAGLPADPRGLLPGLVVGDTSALPPDLEEAMRSVGLTHLTAVSGSNTTLVVAALVVLASWCGLGRRVRLVVALAGLAGFVVLARPDPSVLRAAVMATVALAGLFAGRPTRGLPVLAAAVIALLLADPWLAREFGFVLSVLATTGLLLFARPWAERLQSLGVPRVLAYALAVPTAAQAVCGPVVVLLQPQVNLVTVPANVLVAPAVAPATVLGLAATLVGAVWPFGAVLLAWPAGLCAWWITAVARAAAQAPTALAVPPGAAGVAVVAGSGLVLLLAVAAVPRWWRTGRRRWLALAVVLALSSATLVRCSAGWGGPSGPWPAADWRIVGCDVGQGDAVVLRTGSGSAVLVDAGPDDDLVDGCLERLGVTRLDAVVLTHDHADHVGGFAGAVRDREVGVVWVSPLAVEPAARAVARTAAGAGIPLRVASAGATGAVGEVSWTVLAPRASVADLRSPDSAQVNDSSLVLLAEVAGIRVLLTGDLEPDGQRRLLAQDWPGGNVVVDVVKVAHHGSPKQEPDLYRAARPRVALVEVGEGNDYGHPAPETLAVLDAVGASTLRTDRDGDVAVAGTAQDLRTLVRGSDPREAERRSRYTDG